MNLQRLAQPLDEQAEVVLQRHPGDQIAGDGLGVISGNAKDDEIQRVSLGRIDVMQKRFGTGELG